MKSKAFSSLAALILIASGLGLFVADSAAAQNSRPSKFPVVAVVGVIAVVVVAAIALGGGGNDDEQPQSP